MMPSDSIYRLRRNASNVAAPPSSLSSLNQSPQGQPFVVVGWTGQTLIAGTAGASGLETPPPGNTTTHTPGLEPGKLAETLRGVITLLESIIRQDPAPTQKRP